MQLPVTTGTVGSISDPATLAHHIMQALTHYQL